MKKIKQWLRDWLGITDLFKELNINRGAIRALKGVADNHHDDLKIIKGLVHVGVDAHLHPNARNLYGSWAVVCIEGKADWVQFYDLSNRDIEGLRRFMRDLEDTNRKIDIHPPHMKRWFFR